MYIGFLALLMTMQGCFSTREAEEPGSNSDWQVPLDPEQLMENFERAVLDLNVANYERCFTPSSFRFVPDPDIALQNPGLYEDPWILEQERLYFANLAAASTGTGGNSLQLNDWVSNPLGADSVEYIYNYRLEVIQNKDGFDATVFTGQMTLILVRDQDQRWTIREWQDLNNETEESNTCWTDLKTAFSFS